MTLAASHTPPCYEEIAGVLRGLTIRLHDRPSVTDLTVRSWTTGFFLTQTS
jgi:hypothetical protein